MSIPYITAAALWLSKENESCVINYRITSRLFLIPRHANCLCFSFLSHTQGINKIKELLFVFLPNEELLTSFRINLFFILKIIKHLTN